MKIPNIVLFIFLISIAGCVGVPENITPVKEFDLQKYMGKWYEIARLDHSFERGLENVSAEYSLREGGGVVVNNRGYSTKEQKWKDITGKAFFVNEENEGYFKVSFFGPFYGSYVIFELDHEDYQYAFVSGPNTKYLWFLSRTPMVDQSLMDYFIEKVSGLGFDANELVFVNHDNIQ
jgi:apolipoprotein D and lipocalin family protein